MKTAIQLIAAERERQISIEGWTLESDDAYRSDQLTRAGIAYARHAAMMDNIADSEDLWPWDTEWWKPTTRIRNLTKAAALFAAEIERLQRIEAARQPLLDSLATD